MPFTISNDLFCLTQQSKPQRYSIYYNGREGKAANHHIWEAETIKCLTVLLEKWLEHWIDSFSTNQSSDLFSPSCGLSKRLHLSLKHHRSLDAEPCRSNDFCTRSFIKLTRFDNLFWKTRTYVWVPSPNITLTTEPCFSTNLLQADSPEHSLRTSSSLVGHLS